MARGAVSLVSVAAIVAVGAVCLPTVARASEGITSFKTTLAETGTPLGNVSASGIVEAAPSGESFPMEASTGSTDTVEVSPSTVYSRARPEPGETSSPSLADVAVGDYVGIFGTTTGTIVNATAVVISTPQAGGHPDLQTSFVLESPGSPEAAKNIIFNAPTGVFGNPRALSQCLGSEFALDQCPPDAQAGLITISAHFLGSEIEECSFEYGETTQYGHSIPCSPEGVISTPTQVTAEPTGLTPGTPYDYRLHTTNARGVVADGANQTATSQTGAATFSGHVEPFLLGTAPIFSVVPGPQETARFAFIVPVLDIPISIPVQVRTTTDYGLRFTVQDISQLAPLAAVKLTLWGFPAEENHDAAALSQRKRRHADRLPGRRRHRLHRTPRNPLQHPAPASNRQSDHLHRPGIGLHPRSADLRGPRTSLGGEIHLPRRSKAAKTRSSNLFSRPLRPPTRPTPPRD